jgi:hypothetical protein
MLQSEMIFFYPVHVVYLLTITTKRGKIVMKKIIFLLLLAQTISFLYADSGCIGYRKYQGTDGALSDPADKNAWRWGVKSPKPIECHCNCASYKKGNYKCPGCGHIGIPVTMKLSTVPQSDINAPAIVEKVTPKRKTTAERKANNKRKADIKRKAKAAKAEAKRKAKATNKTTA